MALSPRTRGWVALGSVGVVGVASLGFNAANLAGQGSGFGDALVVAVIPMLAGVSLLVGAAALHNGGYAGAILVRIAGWALGGMALLGLAASLAAVSGGPGPRLASDGRLFVVNAGTIGAAAGLLVGVYDANQRRAQARAERLTHQLTVLHRLLRHDIRNDANVIRGHAELLSRGQGDVDRAARTIEEVATDLVELGEQARVVERMIHEQTAAVEFVDLVALVEKAIDRAAELHGEFAAETDLPPLALAHAHPLIGTAVSSVVDNAVAHNDRDDPRVRISIERVTVAETDYIELTVADNGPGIPGPEVEVLQRGYETALEHTSGLGLWLVNWIVTESDGTVTFSDNEPRGSVVTIRLPDAEDERVAGG